MLFRSPAIRKSELFLTDEDHSGPDYLARKRRGRIVKLPDPEDEREAEAVRAFTTPCVHCSPGARELWRHFPATFERTYEYDG